MTLTLTPTTETHLRELAARRGQAPEEIIEALVAREITEEHPLPLKNTAPVAPHLSPTAALFAQWAVEDKTDDPEELARRQRAGDELLENLRKYPVSFRRVDVSGPGWDE